MTANIPARIQADLTARWNEPHRRHHDQRPAQARDLWEASARANLRREVRALSEA